jgi:hypothetical protein
MVNSIAVGSFTSDGNAKTVVCGFVPDAVILTGTDTPSNGIYFCGLVMAKDSNDLSKTTVTGSAVAGQSTAAAVVAYNSGVAGYVGTSGEGFTVAATASCPENTNAATVRWIALRGHTNLPTI